MTKVSMMYQRIYKHNELVKFKYNKVINLSVVDTFYVTTLH